MSKKRGPGDTLISLLKLGAGFTLVGFLAVVWEGCPDWVGVGLGIATILWALDLPNPLAPQEKPRRASRRGSDILRDSRQVSSRRRR